MMRTLKGKALLALCACLVAAAAWTSCSKCGGKDEAAGAAKPAAGVPKIVAVEAAFDFGKAKQGDEVEHVYKIRNQGDGELRIEKARGS
jgi:hypothetical protein